MNGKKSAPCGLKSQSTVVAGKNVFGTRRSMSGCLRMSGQKSRNAWRIRVSATFRPMCGKWPSTAMCSMLTLLPSKTLFPCIGGVQIISIKSPSGQIPTAEFAPKKSESCKKIMRICGGHSPNCWRNFRRWWRCKRIRPRSDSDRPQTGEPLDPVSRGSRRVWGTTSTSIFARRK